MGRTSRARRRLADAGAEVPEESHEVGIVYYSRYYQLHPGLDFPPCAHPFGPRVEFGCGFAATFMGDNRTFAVALMVPAWDHELKALRDPQRHHAFCAILPELDEYVDPARSRPITDVSSMGALRTTWRAYEHLRPAGFVAVADAFCHTDPSFALGLSLGLVHGFALADDVDGFWDSTAPELRERFELARDVSEVRLARLRGDEVPPSEAAATFAALNAAAREDPDIFRIAFRRAGFLDRLGPVADLPASTARPSAQLSRDDVLAAMAAATP